MVELDAKTPTVVRAVVRVEDVAPTPWRNGGGVTRELLAWPDARDWIVRVSVADIVASGPFSQFPGVDRWFAVLSGGAIGLESAGAAPQVLDASQPALHFFSGDAATHCNALGAVTRDFNVMLRRARGRLHQQPLAQSPLLETSAEIIALFTVQALAVEATGNAGCRLPGMTLAWWHNPRRGKLTLRAEVANARGWWLEVNTTS